VGIRCDSATAILNVTQKLDSCRGNMVPFRDKSGKSWTTVVQEDIYNFVNTLHPSFFCVLHCGNCRTHVYCRPLTADLTSSYLTGNFLSYYLEETDKNLVLNQLVKGHPPPLLRLQGHTRSQRSD